MQLLNYTWIQYLCVCLLPVALYWNTLGHEFVLDDDVVIVKNRFVQEGVGGIPDIFAHDTFRGYERISEDGSILPGGRYRPLSLAVFSLLVEGFGTHPLPFHLLAILLYSLTGLIMLAFLRVLFRETAYPRLLPLAVTLLFLSHPVHTEVVANVKSCDEQLALLFTLLACFALVRYRDIRKTWILMIAGVCFFLGCMSKESVVPVVLAVPFLPWLFERASVRESFGRSIPFILAVAAFLVIRFSVLGAADVATTMSDPLNNPFLSWTGSEWQPADGATKAGTILALFATYVRLLVWPHPLTHDYYPNHIELAGPGDPGSLAGLFLLLCALTGCFLSFKKRLPEGFGLLWFLATLAITLNLFFPIGTFLAERFLYVPSFGAILFLAMLASRWYPGRKAGVAVTIGAVGIFSILTFSRNPAWHDNFSLRKSDLQTSANSIKMQNDYGTMLLDSALVAQNQEKRDSLLQEAYDMLSKASAQHPTYFDAHLAWGASAYYLGKYGESAEAYLAAMRRYPGEEKARLGFGYAMAAHGQQLLEKGDTLGAIPILEEALEARYDNAVFEQLLELKTKRE